MFITHLKTLNIVPIITLSSLAIHTRNLLANRRCSLVVQVCIYQSNLDSQCHIEFSFKIMSVLYIIYRTNFKSNQIIKDSNLSYRSDIFKKDCDSQMERTTIHVWETNLLRLIF